MIGIKYNRLTIKGDAPFKVFPSGRKRQVTAACECGKVGIYVLSALKNGNTKSCGCYKIDRITKHGMSATRQYQIWADMKDRCNNPNNEYYSYYGGRGISYCEKWENFVGFWEDMQFDYDDNLELDRIDSDSDYSPSNCRWSRENVQSHNKSKVPRGERFVGVTKSGTGTYSSRIKMQGKPVSLGTYDSETDAAKAYDDASEILYSDRPNNTTPSDDEILSIVKGRISGKIQNKKFTAKGSDFCHAVLDEDKVLQIFKLAHEKEYTQKQIAEMFGTTQGTVSAIKRGVAWKHVTCGIF